MFSAGKALIRLAVVTFYPEEYGYMGKMLLSEKTSHKKKPGMTSEA